MAADPDYQTEGERAATGGCLIDRIPGIRPGKRRGGFPG
jgi:hypothetical protein